MLNKILKIIDKMFFSGRGALWHIYLGVIALLILPVLFLSGFSLFNIYHNATRFALSENKSEAFLVASILKERLDMLAEFGASIAQRPNLINPLREYKWDEAIEAVGRIPLDFEYVDRVLLVDTQGIIRAQVPMQPNYLGLNRSDTDWYRGVIRERKTYISQVYADPIIPNRNIVAVAVPLKIFKSPNNNADGSLNKVNSEQIVGILLLHVPVITFADLAREQASIDPGEFIFIVDNAGNLVVHPKFPDMRGVIDYKSSPAVQKILAGKKGSEVNYNPIEKEKRMVTFDIVKKYRWGVIVVKPYNLAFMQRSENLRNSAVIYAFMFLLSLIVAGLIVFVLAERKRIDRLKDDFISTVSHEIRNPLFAIRESISQVMEGIRGPITKEQNDFLFIALTSIDRLTKIINDLLDVGKIESGKLRLNLKWCNIVETAKQATAIFLSQAQAKGIEIKMRFPGETLEIFTDGDRIAQVLTNFISNALKFTQRGFIEIAIIDKSDVIECSVADTGVGISKEQLSNIFSKLNKYTSAFSLRGKGTGLGLFISREIIIMHGGSISMDSQEGMGTTVTFKLPKYSPQEAAIRFLDNLIPVGKKNQVLIMLFYDFDNFEVVKKRFTNEKIISIKQKIEQFMNVNVRRISGDKVLVSERSFLIILPQLDTGNATLIAKRIDESIGKYLASEGLVSDIKLPVSMIIYPQVKNKNKDLFARLADHIAEHKMR